jgi:hypothetical protein
VNHSLVRAYGFNVGGNGDRARTLSGGEEEPRMTLNAHHDPMTEAQREEIKRLCREADIPDKSGELLPRQGAHDMLSELRRKAAEHATPSRDKE